MTIPRNDGKPARKANRLGGQKRNVKPIAPRVKAPANLAPSKSIRSLVKIRRVLTFHGWRWKAECRAPRCRWERVVMTQQAADLAAKEHRAESMYKKLHGAKEKAA